MEGYGAWLVAAAVIILVLASYVAVLLMRLWRLSKVQAATQARDVGVVEFQPSSNEYALGARESIRVLARCYLDGQVGGSELCLRVAVLVDQPAMEPLVRQQAAVFVDVAAELAEIPTHETWKSLGRPEREGFRKQMAELEDKHGPAMREAAEVLAK